MCSTELLVSPLRGSISFKEPDTPRLRAGLHNRGRSAAGTPTHLQEDCVDVGTRRCCLIFLLRM